MSSESKNGPRLVVIEGKEKGKIIPLNEGVVIIGRSKGDVVIPDARISRSHVSLHFDASTGRLTFEDLKSLNGTQLNGETATSGELKDGDRLQVGNTVLDCQLGNALSHAPTKSIVKEPEEKEAKPVKRKKEAKVDSFADSLRKEPKLTKEPNWEEGGSEPVLEEAPKRREPVAERTDTTEKAVKKPFRLFAGLKKPNISMPRPTKRTRNLVAALGLLLLIYVAMPKGAPQKAKPTQVADTETVVDVDAEIARLEAELKNNPENSETLLNLGLYYSKQARYDEALVVYRKARTIPNVSPLVHVRLINTFLRTNLTQEVEGELNALDQAIRDGRHSKELFVEAASLYLDFREIKQPPEKTLILSKALQTQYAPGDPVGYKLEIQALLQQNRNDEALNVIAKGLALAPNDEWFLENQAYIYLSQKEIAKAVTSVESWLTFFPQSSKPLLVMGYLKFNQKDYGAVVKYLQRVIDTAKEGSKDPYLGEALSLMGQVYEQNQQLDESARYFKASCDTGFEAACARVASQAPGTPETPAESVAQDPPAATPGQPSPASVPAIAKKPAPATAKKPAWPNRAVNSPKSKSKK